MTEERKEKDAKANEQHAEGRRRDTNSFVFRNTSCFFSLHSQLILSNATSIHFLIADIKKYLNKTSSRFANDEFVRF